MAPDRGLLTILARYGVPFVIIGGHAVNYHGHLRATEDTDILWLPAHTGPSHIGTAMLSDGSLMKRTDQYANGLADGLAKRAALEFRVPAAVRHLLDADQVLARQLAMWVGHATAMANACRLNPSGGGGVAR